MTSTQSKRSLLRLLTALIASAVLVTACAADQAGPLDNEDAADDGSEDPAEPSDDGAEETALDDAGDDEPADDPDDSEAPTDADEPDGVRGVTDDTITIGYVYLDLDDVRERGIVDLNWGPQGDHMQAIVEHINANGGVAGRNLEVISIAFDPVGSTGARAACLELTEDTQVFAVVGAIRRDEVFCYTEQHDTVAIANSDLTQERVERSIAPYASVNASRERTIGLFIDEAVESGLFEGRTVAVMSSDAIEVTEAIAVPALEAAGITVEGIYLTQGDGTIGSAAVEAAAAAEAMKVQGVDTVLVVGDAIVAVNSFIGADFAPTILFTDQGSASTTAGRADLSSFEALYTYGPQSASVRYDDPVFQEHCVAPWNEANPDLIAVNPADVPDREPNHAVGLQIACRLMAIFTSVADSAGPDLTTESFAAALDSLGEFHLPGSGTATLTEGKYDAEDVLRMAIYDETEQAFVALQD